MEFNIYQGEKIIVQSLGKDYLLGEIQKGIKYRIKLFNKDLIILEWALPAILVFRSVNIIYQNLPLPIFNAKHKGVLGFELQYGDNTIFIKVRPLRKTYCFLYSNGEKIGEVYFAKKLTLGYRQFIISTSIEDETTNLYVIISFLLKLIPV